MIKNFNEFVNEDFTDLYDRWKKKEVRKEDLFNPEFVDLGDHTSVYWTTGNLVIDGKDTFTWDEIHDYNNNGWRLPTRKELKEVKWKESSVSWRDGGKNIRFGDKKLKINDPEGRYLGKVIDIWSKTETKAKTGAYYLGILGITSNIETAGKTNHMFVFLVKDKK